VIRGFGAWPIINESRDDVIHIAFELTNKIGKRNISLTPQAPYRVKSALRFNLNFLKKI
jgi:hypothetical protein